LEGVFFVVDSTFSTDWFVFLLVRGVRAFSDDLLVLFLVVGVICADLEAFSFLVQ